MRLVTDESGQVLRHHDYLPFGEEYHPAGWVPENPPADKKLFTGQERDVDTGLDYFGARYYRAGIGRFTTIDPVLDQQAALTDPQRWNRYACVRNNPLRFVDPDGRRDVLVLIWNALARDRSVGHVAILEMNGDRILSPFPEHPTTEDKMVNLSYADTLQREGRQPDAAYRVFVPDDAKFNAAAADLAGRKTWKALPSSDPADSETNCVQAASTALAAGGVAVKSYTWPGNLGDNLSWMAKVGAALGKFGVWFVSAADLPSAGKTGAQ